MCKYIKQSDLHKAYLVSFDVQSLFTNVPVDEVISMILNRLFPSDKLGRKTYFYEGFKYLDFKKALEWCIKDNTFIFNGKFYVQIDGVAMGSPLAPILADIFMNIILESNIDQRNRREDMVIFRDKLSDREFVAKYFTRYVDDIFAAFDNMHMALEFTIEEESEGWLPFLDILLTREESSMTTAVYRKTTHSGVYTHFTSFVPFCLKLQLIRTLLHRAFEICSSYELLHREFERIRVMLMNNGYCSEYIFSVIGRFMTRKFTEYRPFFGPRPKEIYLRVPFLKDTTYKLERSINSCLSQIKCGSLKVKLFYNYCRVGDRLKFKDRSPTINNAIYHLQCSQCEANYVGETKRNITVRMDEHGNQSAKDLTEVAKHSVKYPGHVFNRSNPKILGFEHHTMKRKIKEALFIQKLNPSLNIQEKSYKLFLFNVPY